MNGERGTNSRSSNAFSGENQTLALAGYWPATVMQLVTSERYAAAVQICREHLLDQDLPLSGRIAYGLALFHAGQLDPAAEQFRHVLSVDPEHLAALKYLGDIAFAQGDEWSAMANYRRVMEIDPHTAGLSSPVRRIKNREVTRTISLVRHAEETSANEPRTSRMNSPQAGRRPQVLVSETIGDLYLTQGHPRQAAEIFHRLNDEQPSPRLVQKLKRAMDKISERESTHVAETNE